MIIYTFNWTISSLNCAASLRTVAVLSESPPKRARCSQSWCMPSQATKADSQALTDVTSPDMYAWNSCSGIFKDTAVKFSMKDTAQHYKKYYLSKNYVNI